MELRQDYGKYMSIMKRKRLKIYSEINVLPKTGEYFIPRDDEYTKSKEFRRKQDNTKNKRSLDNDYPKIVAFQDDTIIDVYQRNKTFHTCIPETNNIYFYDVKKKCYYGGSNITSAKNNYQNDINSDENRLLIFMEYTNNTMHRLLKDLKKSKIPGTPDLSAIILVIDSKKIKNIFNVDKYMRRRNLNNGNFNYKPRDTALLFSNVTGNHFDITIEKRCGFKIQIYKNSCRNLLETLLAVCNLSQYFYPAYELKVPALCTRNWYFWNISFGILLSIVLRNINVITLNVMRNLYFVLIKGKDPNLHIQINLILKQTILMLYNADSMKTFLPGSINWTSVHKNILRKSTSLDSILNKLNKKQELRDAIKDVQSAESDYQLTHTLHTQSYEASHSEDGYEADFGDDTSVPYSDTIFDNQSDVTINLTVNRSAATSFIFPTDYYIVADQYRELQKKNASTLCNIKLRSNHSLFGQSKLFLTKVLRGFMINCLYMHVDRDDYINETMFESATAGFYIKFMEKCWKQITCQELYIDILKDLTQSLFHTLFTYTL